MSAPTKKPRTKRKTPSRLRNPVVCTPKLEIDEEFTHWREFFKDVIAKQTEQGLYLAGLRCRENWTQQQLAHKLQVTQAQVSRMERGLRPISLEVARTLATLFRVPFQQFMRDHC